MKKNYVITVGRELGSGGREIAEKLAGVLGIACYDKRLLNIAAERSGLCPEVFEEADEKNKGSLLSSLLNSYLPFVNMGYNQPSCMGNEELFKIQSDTIRSLAADHPCIFVGRCSDYILRDAPHRLDLFITADRHDRTARIMRLHGVSCEEAEKEIDAMDRRRAAYYNYYTDKTWGAAASYHLTVNSSLLGVDGTVDFIRSLAVRTLPVQE